MTEDEYVERRLDDQIDWLDRKSARNQSRFKLLKVFEIAAAAAVPLFVALGQEAGAAASGALVVAISGTLLVNKWDETWVSYRSTWSALQREKMLHQTRVEPYDVEATRYPRLVRRIEGILSAESAAWTEIRGSTAESE